MIRIGHGKPRISVNTDRWGQLCRTRSVNDYGLCGPERWQQILWFQGPAPCKGSLIDLLGFSKADLESKMRLAGGKTVWEMNFLCPNLEDSIRFNAFIEVDDTLKLVTWSWVDTYIKYPLLKAYCKIWNRAIALLDRKNK